MRTTLPSYTLPIKKLSSLDVRNALLGPIDEKILRANMFNPENAQNEVEFLNRKEGQTLHWNSVELTIPPTVYRPREDTQLLHDVLQTVQPFGSHRLLEIGSGSGAISIAAAQQGWTVHACDVNPYAVAATRFNAQQARVEVEVDEGGLGPLQGSPAALAWTPGSYDVVVWNMPYIPLDEVQGELLGPMEEAALVDTHPEGLVTVVARWMRSGNLCTMGGIGLIVCRERTGWRRSVDVLRHHGLAARTIKRQTFSDDETIQVVAVWHPFVLGKHHSFGEIDSTNAEMLRNRYHVGDSLTAMIQTAGRGRHGNDWHDHHNSFKGSWMLDPDHFPDISPRRQLQVAQEIRLAIPTQQHQDNLLLVKWPNDLLVRSEGEEQWRKYGGILFQSYSKGDEQRLVLGIGINTKQDSLNFGQGAIEEIGIRHTASELFPILNAVVASMFEKKHPAVQKQNSESTTLESMLRTCFYREKKYTVASVSMQGLILEDDHGTKVTVEDDANLTWISLHPQ